jgi:hypothetical protein
MLQRCEHFPQTNHTRPSTTDTNSTVIESHAGQRWRSEPAGRSGLDTAILTAVCRTDSRAPRATRRDGPVFADAQPISTSREHVRRAGFGQGCGRLAVGPSAPSPGRRRLDGRKNRWRNAASPR